MRQIPELLDQLSRSSFRARFNLSQTDRATATIKGLAVMHQHAREIISKRLAAAEPVNDGKQTPMRGYPVFVAQHATATCCRGCLAKWHRIPEHHQLTDTQITYIADVITAWIRRQLVNK
jgi:hypothetical protein